MLPQTLLYYKNTADAEITRFSAQAGPSSSSTKSRLRWVAIASSCWTQWIIKYIQLRDSVTNALPILKLRRWGLLKAECRGYSIGLNACELDKQKGSQILCLHIVTLQVNLVNQQCLSEEPSRDEEGTIGSCCCFITKLLRHNPDEFKEGRCHFKQGAIPCYTT